MSRSLQPPSFGTQSVKTKEKGDFTVMTGRRRVGGRKRYILVDTMRLLINAVVHSAAVVDLARAFLALGAAYGVYDRLKLIWADMGYRGPKLKAWVGQELGWEMETVKRPPK